MYRGPNSETNNYTPWGFVVRQPISDSKSDSIYDPKRFAHLNYIRDRNDQSNFIEMINNLTDP